MPLGEEFAIVALRLGSAAFKAQSSEKCLKTLDKNFRAAKFTPLQHLPEALIDPAIQGNSLLRGPDTQLQKGLFQEQLR